MKKRILPLLLLLSLLLSGCSRGSKEEEKKPAENPGPNRPQTVETEPEASAEPIIPSPEIFLTFEPESQLFTDEETGAALLSYLNSTPRVTLTEDENAEKAMNTELMKLSEEFRSGGSLGDGENGGVNALLNAARTDLEDRGAGTFCPYASERHVRVSRCDAAVLSLVYEDYGNIGGAHGYTNTFGVSFDVRSGQKLTLADLCEDNDALKSYCLGVLRSQCSAMSDWLFEDYDSYLPQLLEGSEWYFNESGLVFVANPYLIAPYAAGTLEFTVSYKQLSELLNGDYLPPARTMLQGGLDGCVASEIDLTPQEPLLKLDASDIGETFAFWAKNSVYSVRVRRAVFREETARFEEGEELLCISRMDDGQYFLLKTDVPDTLPNLMLTWRLPDSSVQRLLISQSGMDGSLILTDPNTFPLLAPGEISSSLPWFQYDLNGVGAVEAVDVSEAEGIWTLRVSGTEELSARLPFTARPSVYLADVDGDGCTEILLCGKTEIVPQAVYVYRYDSDLHPVPFRENGVDLPYMPCRILGADTEELMLSGTVSVFGAYSGCRAYGDGPEGTVAPAYGSEWDLSGNQERLTTAADLPFEQLNGSVGRLSTGTTLRIIGFDGVQKVRFEADGGVEGWFYVTKTKDGKHAINGKSEELCFQELN